MLNAAEIIYLKMVNFPVEIKWCLVLLGMKT